MLVLGWTLCGLRAGTSSAVVATGRMDGESIQLPGGETPQHLTLLSCMLFSKTPGAGLNTRGGRWTVPKQQLAINLL